MRNIWSCLCRRRPSTTTLFWPLSCRRDGGLLSHTSSGDGSATTLAAPYFTSSPASSGVCISTISGEMSTFLKFLASQLIFSKCSWLHFPIKNILSLLVLSFPVSILLFVYLFFFKRNQIFLLQNGTTVDFRSSIYLVKDAYFLFHNFWTNRCHSIAWTLLLCFKKNLFLFSFSLILLPPMHVCVSGWPFHINITVGI